MSQNRNVSGEVGSEIDLRRTFEDIREDVSRAESGPALAELYRRAWYLITLTYAPPWGEKFDERGENLRRIAEREFQETARMISHRAAQLGTKVDYHETWGT